MYLEKGLNEKHCGICDKLIIPTPYWAYKIRIPNNKPIYYCSYTCYRKAGGDSGKYCLYVGKNGR